LIPEGSGWELSGALSINNAEQIVGYGTFDGEQRGFLLTPVSVPEPGLLFGMGAIFLWKGHAIALLAARLKRPEDAS